MIDELDAFNAAVTLALARVARFNFKVAPQLASEVSQVAIGASDGQYAFARLGLFAEDRKHEDAALAWVFNRSPQRSLFGVYSRFWMLFPYRCDDIPQSRSMIRITVNAPAHSVLSLSLSPIRHQVEARYDVRLGLSSPVPERWAVPLTDSAFVDDIVLFSDDLLMETEIRKLLALVGPGTTITFVKPGTRCEFWFKICGVRHDFSQFMRLLVERAEFETLHESDKNAAVMVTILGVKTLKV